MWGRVREDRQAEVEGVDDAGRQARKRRASADPLDGARSSQSVDRRHRCEAFGAQGKPQSTVWPSSPEVPEGPRKHQEALNIREVRRHTQRHAERVWHLPSGILDGLLALPQTHGCFQIIETTLHVFRCDVMGLFACARVTETPRTNGNAFVACRCFNAVDVVQATCRIKKMHGNRRTAPLEADATAT